MWTELINKKSVGGLAGNTGSRDTKPRDLLSLSEQQSYTATTVNVLKYRVHKL